MKMRGIYSSVTDIRRKVFTEVARLAYEEGDYAEKIAELPYKIAVSYTHLTLPTKQRV